MVLDYYKLREEPFGVTPDARFLHLSATHREALASLLYGVAAGRGFIALIAKPGMGKTTLLIQSLEQLRETAKTVFLFQTISTPLDFLRALLTDLGLDAVGGDLIELQSKLNQVLLDLSCSGKQLIVFVDEAQNLDGSVFELVRMLSNFETPREKLMQIVLCGQPQLAEKLASASLEQLRQRVSMIAQLEPFSLEETRLYIEHRLHVAGYSADTSLFTDSALALIATRSEGIPRNINNLCFNALSLGCALKRKIIDTGIVLEVLGDLDLEPLREKRSLAERPEREEAREVPAFAAVASPPSALAAGFAKVAAAGAIVLCLAGALFALPHFRNVRSDRSAQSDQTDGSAVLEAAVRTTHAIPPLVPIAPSSAGVDRNPQPVTSASTIRVTAGKTLYRICVESFGRCNPEHLQEIRRLNPWLSNPDHIESGERIRIPGATDNLIGQAGSASPAERGAQ